LIDDTPPGCGGFTLYPRSHSRLYELARELRAEGVDDADVIKSRVAALTKAIETDTEPIDCHGPAGTVVFWHRCTAHKVPTPGNTTHCHPNPSTRPCFDHHYSSYMFPE